MSDETQAAFRDAYDAHMRARKDAAVLGDSPDTVDTADLKAAAQAHIEGSASIEKVHADLLRRRALLENGENDDKHVQAEAAAEETYAWLATATAVLAGAPLAASIGV